MNTDRQITVTTFKDKLAASCTTHLLTFEQLATKLENVSPYREKDACPLLKLATFGDHSTEKGSLRHDANVLAITGIEGDYDDGRVTIDEAAAKLHAAGIQCILYSSPSSTEEKPRWRVLALTSKALRPEERRVLVAKVNGVLDGKLAPESFTLSQAYYFGRVNGCNYKVLRVDGEPIDLKANLPEVYPSSGKGGKADYDETPDAELIECFKQGPGNGRQKALLKLSSRLAARGMLQDDIAAALLAMFPPDIDPRNDAGEDLREKIPQIAQSAYAKYGDHRRFRDESRAIGEGIAVSEAPPPILTLLEMLERNVFISDGSQVASRDDPRMAWAYADYVKLTAASKTPVTKTKQDKKTGAEKEHTAHLPTAPQWLAHPQRTTVHGRTFRAGGELITKSPDDRLSVNTWREPPWIEPPEDWREVSRLFLSHVEYLIPKEQERHDFLDWLAHIEQRPGVLPHWHFLMIATRHGIGRNWLACLLARVFAGNAALDVDLGRLLDNDFNGKLARKILVVVNEVREGAGANVYRHADKLRQLLTDETRTINPKYGRQYDEWNSARWLMFSNHQDALPLDRFDRRVYVIENPDEPRPLEYYEKLYAAAGDPAFIASVRQVLRSRDISHFKPGMAAPLNEAKQAAISSMASDEDVAMRHLIESYPRDVITSGELMARVFGTDADRAVRARSRYIAQAAGARRYPHQVRIDGKQVKVWILRCTNDWIRRKPDEVGAELLRKLTEKEWEPWVERF